MDEFWGIVVAILFVVGLAYKAYMNYAAHAANRAMIEMNERQRRNHD